MDEASIVASVFKRKETDSAFRAALKKANNPDTAYMSWEYLADYGIQIQYESSRIPYEIVLSAIAGSEANDNGNMRLGQAIALCYDDGKESAPAKSKLRRILACDSLIELCSVLKPQLRFIYSKGISIDYSILLKELRWFEKNSEQIKATWAQSFFGTVTDIGDKE